MELVYCSQNLERVTKTTCKEIKEKIITLERTIEILQEKRKELLKNKKIKLPPAGIPSVSNQRWNNPSILAWSNSLRR